MGQIIDYKCVNLETSNHIREAAEKLGLKLPESHFCSESMAELSKKIKENRDHPFCILPFCHTIEAESLGADINYGDENTGPRVKSYRYSSLTDVMNMELDYSRGRIGEVLKAIKILKDEGEVVLLEVTGPITLLSSLLDAKYVYKGLRKDKEMISRLFNKVKNILIDFIKKAGDIGADIISFADSTAGVNILGPKMSVDLLDLFTVDFLNKYEVEFGKRLLMHLCPKTTYALMGDERAEFRDVNLEGEMTYGEAMVNLRGKVTFLGDRCLNHLMDKITGNKMREIIINK